MSEARHTPGPWKAMRLDHGWHIGPHPGGVCTIHDNTDGSSRSEQEANARLIASAPELLAQRDALREAAEKVEGYLDYPGGTMKTAAAPALTAAECRDILRTAIAKAKP